MKLVTVSEMRMIEKEADKNSLSYSKMMENAGRGLADEIESLVHIENSKREVIGLVGPGNNGGDTLVALTRLAANGWKASAYLLRRDSHDEDLIEDLKKAGGAIISGSTDHNRDHLTALVRSAEVIVDGVLGTGIQLPLKNEIATVLSTINTTIAELSWPPYVIAVDCPSGVNCDTGETAEETIPASITVCMAAVKTGLLKFPAFDMVGELRVVDIGLSDDLPSWKNINHFVADDQLIETLLPVRASDSHKGTFGTALITAGSINYIGAPLLAGRAAYKIGAGLVQLAVPGPVQIAIAGNFPEAIWILLPQEMGVISAMAADVLFDNLERSSGLLIGPGFGTEDTTKVFIENLLSGKGGSRKHSARIGFTHSDLEKPAENNVHLPPMVVDADALRLLAKIEDWSKLLPQGSVLTPHPGEMSSLTGLDKNSIQSDRINTARKYAQVWNHIVILKGAFTVVAAPDGRITVIPIATSALAHAGTGDVLAGLVVGLIAQGVESYDAAVAAAWIHAQAGLLAAENLGSEASVLASDVVDAIPGVISFL